MLKRISRLSFACIVAVSLCGWAVAHDRDDRDSHSAMMYGYHNGYLDGFQHGREDWRAQVGYDFNNRDYDAGSRGYERYMGRENQYRNGYREGYSAGYDDGFYGRGDRFNGPPRQEPYYGEARTYNTLSPDAPQDLAYQAGFRDGLLDGGKDRRHNKDFRPEKHDRYEDADHGYTHDYGKKSEYKHEYREGYVAGYQRGYGDSEGHWGG